VCTSKVLNMKISTIKDIVTEKLYPIPIKKIEIKKPKATAVKIELIQAYPIYFSQHVASLLSRKQSDDIDFLTWKNDIELDYSRGYRPREYKQLLDIFSQMPIISQPSEEWLKSQTDYLRTLSTEDLELISRYGHGGGSRILNIEKNVTEDDVKLFSRYYDLLKGYTPKEIKQYLITRLEHLILKSPPLDHPITVFRGSTRKHLHTKTDNITSTTGDILIALIYAGHEDEIDGTLDVIECIDTPCLFMSPLAQDGDSEFEIIFPRNITINEKRAQNIKYDYRGITMEHITYFSTFTYDIE
jgi:hypothetical protein